jgi:cob(I)alamin adenosyltransferase
MLQLDTRYILMAFIIVVVVGGVYLNSKVTTLEETSSKLEKFNSHIGDAFKPLHQKYAEHETRLSNVDESLRNIRNKLASSKPEAPKKKVTDDDDDDDLVNKLRM